MHSRADGRWIAYIPAAAARVDKPFLMPSRTSFRSSGRGTVVTGRIEQGVVKVGEEMEIVGIRETMKKVVTGVEMFKKLLDRRGRRQRGLAAARHGAHGRGARPGAVRSPDRSRRTRSSRARCTC